MSRTINAWLIFYKADGLHKFQEIQLENAYCTSYEEVFDPNGPGMYIDFIITHGILCGHEIKSPLSFYIPEEEEMEEIGEEQIKRICPNRHPIYGHVL